MNITKAAIGCLILWSARLITLVCVHLPTVPTWKGTCFILKQSSALLSKMMKQLSLLYRKDMHAYNYLAIGFIIHHTTTCTVTYNSSDFRPKILCSLSLDLSISLMDSSCATCCMKCKLLNRSSCFLHWSGSLGSRVSILR